VSEQAVEILKQGGVIAYPTEAVFGFGCDPFNQNAVQRILKLKDRNAQQGLILIAANWQQVKTFVAPLEENILQKVFDKWPGPNTFVFPASDKAPKWVCADGNTIAIRITDHEVAKKICEGFNGAIVSTSVNKAGEEALTTYEQVVQEFVEDVDYVVEGEVGGAVAPSTIIDAVTGVVLRE